MDFIAVILIMAVVFGICYLIDLGFRKIFRNQQQHRSGLAVRLNKRYGSIGVILMVLGCAALIRGIPTQSWILAVAGGILILIGIGLIVFYLTFGVFYDDDAFVLTTFGKKSKTYQYDQITAQQLYLNYGQVVIELYLNDGRTFQLQSSMEGVYPFLDKAFARWLEQTGTDPDTCDFYDPANSCWFPPVEAK